MPLTSHLCPHCGEAISAGAKYCSNCGTSVEVASIKTDASTGTSLMVPKPGGSKKARQGNETKLRTQMGSGVKVTFYGGIALLIAAFRFADAPDIGPWIGPIALLLCVVSPLLALTGISPTKHQWLCQTCETNGEDTAWVDRAKSLLSEKTIEETTPTKHKTYRYETVRTSHRNNEGHEYAISETDIPVKVKEWRWETVVKTTCQCPTCGTRYVAVTRREQSEEIE